MGHMLGSEKWVLELQSIFLQENSPWLLAF